MVASTLYFLLLSLRQLHYERQSYRQSQMALSFFSRSNGSGSPRLIPRHRNTTTTAAHCQHASCLITYWRHGPWLDAVNCPLCRQKVSVMCQLFSESRLDRQSKDVAGQISDYNKRYSGAPRRIRDYLSDAPLLLQLAIRGLGTLGGLVWLFFLRVALCCVGTAVSMASPSGSPKAPTSLCGLLGLLDDLVVVVLLLLCVLNVNHQMVPERGRSQTAPVVIT
ncbi:RING-HC_RNF170 domain-containing protein isoform X2 [Corythoichthys intestinalis]|uniref:RING-HC_RNF170 domain-containing protein isoform X2 n=1 Tax=Corythoichthys intestinalis TaxID=161448 RepID=UPI0025A51BDD|nr:RING-HC_RNF170 domain-containing protein isoform X2 [Corythoichthys intestinalis]